jgi:cyclic 2,3-diphosphoglycerate synthase
MRVVALVDGEHYPSVTRWGVDAARTLGHDVLAAVFVGGSEKIDVRAPPDLGVRTIHPETGSVEGTLTAVLEELRPDAVLDLSDEPVLGYRERMELAARVLVLGIAYLGADFRLDPPISGEPLSAPTVAVIGTGKRTGKTAICAAAARVAAARGVAPVVVAMGRGGPPEPEVAEPGTVTLASLEDLARSGRHAASDYLEDAVTAGVPTIGARRVGGGLAGAPFASNVRAAAELAAGRRPGVVLLEGSGACIPPIPWDAGILVVPVSAPPEYLGGYLGPLRLLLSDLVVFTMAGSPTEGLTSLPALKSHVQRIRGDARFVVTDFRPAPMGEVRGRDVFFATTAPQPAAARQVAHLESAHGCRVVGWSARLADRARLARDMDEAPSYEVLLTELKAAAVDVASERAGARGAEVVFVDNRAEIVEGDGDLAEELAATVDLAVERSRSR